MRLQCRRLVTELETAIVEVVLSGFILRKPNYRWLTVLIIYYYTAENTQVD